jgi:hypothetical protein
MAGRKLLLFAEGIIHRSSYPWKNAQCGRWNVHTRWVCYCEIEEVERRHRAVTTSMLQCTIARSANISRGMAQQAPVYWNTNPIHFTFKNISHFHIHQPTAKTSSTRATHPAQFTPTPPFHPFSLISPLLFTYSECRDSRTQPELQLCRGCMECTVR